MLALATDTPDFMRARNATDILSQVGMMLSVLYVGKKSHKSNRLRIIDIVLGLLD